MGRRYPYRVFISYDREDAKLFDRVEAVFKSFDFLPICDRRSQIGKPFPDELRKLISRSHCFTPIVTERSCESAWVNQEIGYALSLGIPVIPLKTGDKTGPGMLEMLQHIETEA